MLIGQNFNSYNVNSKPLGFRGGKADAAKKIPQTLDDILELQRKENAKNTNGSVDKAVKKFVDWVGKKAPGKK